MKKKPLFSEHSLKILKNSGWTPERRINIDNYIQQQKKNGHIVFPIAQEFLEQFGNLHIKHEVEGKIHVHLDFQIMWDEENNNDNQYFLTLLDKYAKFVGSPLCYIGRAMTNHSTLLMNPSGEVYGVFGEMVAHFGNSGEEAIENSIARQKSIKFIGEVNIY